MRIWKYPLKMTDKQVVEMPYRAKILTVQVQFGTPCLWALVDETNIPGVKLTPRTITIYGTGNPMPVNPGVYIGTFQVRGGDLVFHVFEE